MYCSDFHGCVGVCVVAIVIVIDVMWFRMDVDEFVN